MRTPKKMIVKHKGKTYWATLTWFRNRPVFRFWSSHKWPFYHAHYMPDVIHPEDVWQKFEEFIPGYNGESR